MKRYCHQRLNAHRAQKTGHSVCSSTFRCSSLSRFRSPCVHEPTPNPSEEGNIVLCADHLVGSPPRRGEGAGRFHPRCRTLFGRESELCSPASWSVVRAQRLTAFALVKSDASDCSRRVVCNLKAVTAWTPLRTPRPSGEFSDSWL